MSAEMDLRHTSTAMDGRRGGRHSRSAAGHPRRAGRCGQCGRHGAHYRCPHPAQATGDGQDSVKGGMMPEGWERLAGHEGGTVVALAVAPTEGGGILFAATATGLFTSVDGGRTWSPGGDPP